MSQTHFFEFLAETRPQRFSYRILGPDQGLPLLAFHGTPGSRLDFFADDKSLVENNLRIIAVDRPGYGDSDAWPGYTLEDFACVMEALANHLRLTQFALLGFSGGAPHALALAQRLPTRVNSLHLFSPQGPLDGELLDLLPDISQQLYRLAVQDVTAVTKQLSEMIPSSDALLATFESLVAAPDQAVFQDAVFRQSYGNSFAAAISQGMQGMAEDLRICGQPWGFSLNGINAPTNIWQGTKDLLIPSAMAEYLANRIPAAELKFLTDKGHYSLMENWSDSLQRISRTRAV